VSEGDAPPAAFAFPTARRCAPRRRVVLLRRAFQPLADPDHPDRTSCPPNSSVRRIGLAVTSGRTLQTRHRWAAIVQAKCPNARCRFATALPPARRMTRRLSGTSGVNRDGPAPQGAGDRWSETTGAQGRPSAGSGRAARVALCPPRNAAFRQAAPAARPASCAPRPHCECPGRHCAAWRSSPWHCGWSPPCPAAYRR
jgi:hypothetical protein